MKRVRTDLGLTQADLSRRLTENGHPIPVASIGRIETGDRRVEVDDLMALAVVLNVSPLSLLLPYTRNPYDLVEVTGWGSAIHALSVWGYGTAAHPLDLDGSVEDMHDDLQGFRSRSMPWWVDVQTREMPLGLSAARAWGHVFESSGEESERE